MIIRTTIFEPLRRWLRQPATRRDGVTDVSPDTHDTPTNDHDDRKFRATSDALLSSRTYSRGSGEYN